MPHTHLTTAPPVRITQAARLPGVGTLHSAPHGLPSPVIITLAVILVLCLASGAVAAVQHIRRADTLLPSRAHRVLGRVRYGVVITAALALLASFATAGTASAQLTSGDSAGPGWGTAQRIDPVTHQVYNVSCPTSGFCMATSQYGHVWTYNGSTWTSQNYVHVNGGGPVACASASFCLMVNKAGAVLTWTPSGPSSRSGWSIQHYLTYATGSYLTADLTSVSCPTASFCVAVGANDAWTYTSGTWSTGVIINPQHSAADWRDYISSVSCTSASFCVAVTLGGYSIVYNGSTWTSQAIGAGSGITSVSCVTATGCVAVNNAGSAFFYNGTSWSAGTSVAGTNWLASVSCATTSFCVAVDRSGGVAIIDGTTGKPYSSVASDPFTSVSCAPRSQSCVAVDNHGQTYDVQITFLSTTSGVSCAPSTSTCIAVGKSATYGVPASAQDGAAARSTNGGKTWSNAVTVPGTYQLYGVSCVSSSDCVAVGYSYNPSASTGRFTGVAAYTTDGGKVWSTPVTVSGTQFLYGVSCASASDCVAVGRAKTTTNGVNTTTGATTVTTNGGATWSQPIVVPGTADLNAVSCASASDCVAVGDHGDYGVTTTTTDGGASWSAPVTVPGIGSSGKPAVFYSVSCASASDCAAVGSNGSGNGAATVTANGGTSWSTALRIPLTSTLYGVSCTSTSDCVAVGSNGSGITTTTTNAGKAWDTPVAVSGSVVLHAVSCASSSDCAAVGSGRPFFIPYTGWLEVGMATSSTSPFAASPSWTTPSDLVQSVATPAGHLFEAAVYNTLMGGSCVSDASTGGQFCAIGGGSGNLITGTLAPTGKDGTSVFTQSSSQAMGGGNITAVSCASTSFCVAADGQGNIDTWNGSKWTLKNLVPAPGVVFMGVSCPTTSFCVAVDVAGRVWTYNGTSWSSQALSSHPLLYLSCTSASFCMAVSQYPTSSGFATASYTYTGKWSAATTSPATRGIDGLSCISSSSCVATNGVQGTEMTWASGTWSKPSAGVALGTPAPPAPVPNEGFQGVACTATLCIAGGYYSGYGFTTTEANATSTSPIPWNGDPVAQASGPYGASMLGARSCVRGAHTVCLAAGENGSLATYTGPAPYLNAAFTLSSSLTTTTAAAAPGACTASSCTLTALLPPGSPPSTTAPGTVTLDAIWPDEATAGSKLACTWSITPAAQTWASTTSPCPTNADQTPSYTGAFAAGTYTISLTASASGYPNASVNPVRPVTGTAKLIVQPSVGDCPLSGSGQQQTPVLSIVSGSGQSVSAASTVYPHPLTVEAQCKDGTMLKPLANATVTWTAPSTGASGTITTPASPCPSTTPTATTACTLTDSSGEASITIRSNSTPGKWTLPATWDGQSASFALNNYWVQPAPVGIQYPT